MPTLYLIDADSSQACPAVLEVIRRRIESSRHPGDRLVLLGGSPLVRDAQAVGIHHAHRVSVRFGNTRLTRIAVETRASWPAITANPRQNRRLGADWHAHGLSRKRITRALGPWARSREPFGLIDCWSPGALSLAVDHWPDTPKALTLVHRPTGRQLAGIKHALTRPTPGPVRINTPTRWLSALLAASGVQAETVPLPPQAAGHDPARDAGRETLRRCWGADGRGRVVVALLSDHPGLADAIDAAMITTLAVATLNEDGGEPTGMTLLVHPDQLHRQRAQDFLDFLAVGHRVVQEARLGCPWRILHGCDAALALGPDAGGLSLGWALSGGLPVVASANGSAGERPGGDGNPVVSASDAHKDLAHALHGVLEGSDSIT
jgi:hypothetical protein